MRISIFNVTIVIPSDPAQTKTVIPSDPELVEGESRNLLFTRCNFPLYKKSYASFRPERRTASRSGGICSFCLNRHFLVILTCPS
jgi:hypothetical protein